MFLYIKYYMHMHMYMCLIMKLLSISCVYSKYI